MKSIDDIIQHYTKEDKPLLLTRNYRDAMKDYLITKAGALFTCTVCGYSHIGGKPYNCLNCGISHEKLKES